MGFECFRNRNVKFLNIFIILIVCIISVFSIRFLCINHNFNANLKLKIYKFFYKKYQRIFNNNLNTRFNKQKLDLAIVNARNQPWVMEQIKADLKPFIQTGLSEKAINQLYINLGSNLQLKYHLVKFKIKNHKITAKYIDEDIQYFHSYKTLYSMIKILNEYRLIPDCTFIVYLNDYLNYIPKDIKEPIPVFTFAKDTAIPLEKDTILIPDWMNLYYWDVLRGRIDLAKKIYPWAKKEAFIHWRGAGNDSMQHRQKLVELRDKLEFLDVGMTNGPNRVPFLEPEFSLKYKYQVALDGARCAWERVVWQMYSNCLMIKPKSTQVQWFYRGLKENYNYFSIEDIDQSNLTEAYKWLIDNDKQVQQIIKHANEFAEANLKTQDFFAYYVLLLEEYAKLIRD